MVLGGAISRRTARRTDSLEVLSDFDVIFFDIKTDETTQTAFLSGDR